jgi:hypothetical protein
MTGDDMRKPNLYESSEGNSVEILGRTGLAYREGDRCALVDSEVLMPPAGILVYQDTITGWQSPHDLTRIGPEDRERILRNIAEIMATHGIDIQVI